MQLSSYSEKLVQAFAFTFNLYHYSMGSFVAAELGMLAPKLEVLELSECDIGRVADLHAMLASLPQLRILLFSGDGGARDGVGAGYYVGMATHPSLEYCAFSPTSPTR